MKGRHWVHAANATSVSPSGPVHHHANPFTSSKALPLDSSRSNSRFASGWAKTSGHDAPDSSHGGRHPSERGRDKLAQRDFFLDVLNVSATRRDAKQYLSRFKSPAQQNSGDFPNPQEALKGRQDRLEQEQWRLLRTGVNLGHLYEPTKAIADSPTFVHQVRQEHLSEPQDRVVHVALVSIRSPELMDDNVLSGVALTFSQLVRLDMQIVVTFSCGGVVSQQATPAQVYQRQADRLVRAFEQHNNSGARYVDSALSVSQDSNPHGSLAQVRGVVAVEIPKLILEPLKRSAIPVIPALAYTKDTKSAAVDPADVILALTRALSGVADVVQQHPPGSPEPPGVSSSLDRIIMLDPLGGLPSQQREDKAHVFVNLDQEYDQLAMEFQRHASTAGHAAEQHLQNLDILRSCLSLLPPASSALLISPEEAASSSQRTAGPSDSIGISTRRQKNPLIHNLLTNKPIISSSLPAARLSSEALTAPTDTAIAPTRSTLVKRGMPVMIIPSPWQQPWLPPRPGEPTISLENHPDINFPRLLALIEDSFRRPLDVKHYLDRIRNRVAGVIIAGEYEGGAILTWEAAATTTTTNGTPPDPAPRLVPYLDKFAVLQRSQGAAGVADIVFQSMVRTCFPAGVCWRSRQDNPVNKWYFERSRGTWKLHGTQWTMFWTTDGLVQDRQRWEDYASVCRSVEPSWADSKKPD